MCICAFFQVQVFFFISPIRVNFEKYRFFLTFDASSPSLFLIDTCVTDLRVTEGYDQGQDLGPYNHLGQEITLQVV